MYSISSRGRHAYVRRLHTLRFICHLRSTAAGNPLHGDATDLAALNAYVIGAMFTGSSRIVSVTSEQVFSSTLAMGRVPDDISSLKTVKVSAILAFVEKICTGSLSGSSEMSKHVLKLNCSGDVIRSTLGAISITIRTEYKAVDFPDFIAQIALHVQLLSRLVTQSRQCRNSIVTCPSTILTL